jgi:hypothetical protein
MEIWTVGYGAWPVATRPSKLVAALVDHSRGWSTCG